MEEIKVLIDGEEKLIHVVARLELSDTGIEYIYYYIKEENDTDDTQKYLIASRVENDGEYDTLYDIEDEEERKIVFDAFTTVYGNLE